MADLAIGRLHLNYVTVSSYLTALLVAVLTLPRTSVSLSVTADFPLVNARYWLAMITAGALGTVLGDGIGHVIRPITVGVPVFAVIATATVALIFVQGTRLDRASAGAASYLGRYRCNPHLGYQLR